jgi:hypothetical protein
MTTISEVKAASFMANNMDRTIKQWAKDLGLPYNKTNSIYQKYVKLGLLNKKGINRERQRKLAYMAYHQYHYNKIKSELEL